MTPTLESAKARVIAFYLPQFHPIPENDAWWGKGFTEWTNVARAKPLFRGHYQPHVPADLGFYDLRLPEAREAQANLARAHGIEGFCYWHYWFGGGRRILERPFDEVLSSGRPDLPFCLAWANQSWSGIWHGAPERILIEQTYPGDEDHTAHFLHLLPAFRDARYMKVHGKPIFVVYAPPELPAVERFAELWNRLALEHGLPGIYFVGNYFDFVYNVPSPAFDGLLENLPFIGMPAPPAERLREAVRKFVRNLKGRRDEELVFGRRLVVRRYDEFVRFFASARPREREHPLLIPNWDNTPRSGDRGIVLRGSTPELFREICEIARGRIESVPDPQRRLVFVRSWNEWAEGNHLEPDLRFGTGYLEALKAGLRLG